ncbi:MAG: hypothetical protein FWG15_00390 [Propionibacteriaceae bacterium]|nr:hypothetical protein [Propionibacteriaceae bacterium]
MKASLHDIEKLLEIQDLDTSIAKIKLSASTLPIHQEIADLVERRSHIADDLTAATTNYSDATVASERAEADVVPVRERLARYVAKVEAAEMDPKALQSAIEEVAHLKSRISDLEDVELLAMETAEQAGQQVEELKAETEQIEVDLHGLVEARDQEVSQLAAQARDLTGQRRETTSLISPELLGLYEKVAARANGVGIARLQGRRCSGCGLEATVADYNSYIAADPEQVIRCAECDRLLARTP